MAKEDGGKDIAQERTPTTRLQCILSMLLNVLHTFFSQFLEYLKFIALLLTKIQFYQNCLCTQMLLVRLCNRTNLLSMLKYVLEYRAFDAFLN